MKMKKITSFIIAGCISLGGLSAYSNTEDSAIVSISSSFVQGMHITVPDFPTNKKSGSGSNWQTTANGELIQVPSTATPVQIPQKGNTRTQNTQQTEVKTSTTYGFDDPGISMQYAISETNANLAWAEVEQKETVTIAIIDTGVDYTHEDLKNRVSTEYGYDFINNDNDPMDDNGHGTHVAGIIGAEGNNGVGIVGMVGDLDIEIIPIKALDADGVSNVPTVVKAIEYAISLDVDIINLSFGTESKSKDLDEAVAKAIANDIFVVVASGNSSTLSDFSSPLSVEGVCAVGATNESSMISSFSNFGTYTDIGAPGESIVSTYPNNEYSAQSGTSMATPMITSVVALLIAQDPTLTITEINSLLVDNVNDVYRDRLNQQLSFGIVDFYESIADLK